MPYNSEPPDAAISRQLDDYFNQGNADLATSVLEARVQGKKPPKKKRGPVESSKEKNSVEDLTKFMAERNQAVQEMFERIRENPRDALDQTGVIHSAKPMERGDLYDNNGNIYRRKNMPPEMYDTGKRFLPGIKIFGEE